MGELAFSVINAMGKALLNPIIYWMMIVSLFISYKRVKEERKIFNQELFPLGYEYKGSIHITIFGSIIISIIMILFQVTFVSEIIFFLSIIIFVLSFIFGFKMLSAAYTLGFTFILFKILEFFGNTLIVDGLITDHSFSSIALLIALFLFVEAYMYSKIKNHESFPEIIKSKRGSYLGIYKLQKISFIPFIVFIPTTMTSSASSIMPMIELNEQQFSIMLIPFFTAFHYIVSGQLPETTAKQLKRNHSLLALIVLLLALISYYLPGIAFFAVILAIIGKWLIDYLFFKYDRKKEYYFLELNEPLKIFAIVPHSPASKLGLQIGDTITKVNNQPVRTLKELNEQLEKVLYFPTFEVVTKKHEVVLIENDTYRGNYDDLGIIFVTSAEKNSKN